MGSIFSILICHLKRINYYKKNIRLILIPLLVASFAFSPVISLSAWACYPPHPPKCQPSPAIDLVGYIVEATGQAKVTNSSELCSYDLGLAVYKMPDSNIDNQELFDSDLGIIGPGETLNLEVNLPDCAYQIDLFYGQLIESFEGGLRYDQRKLDWRQSLNGGYCSEPTYAISGMKFNDQNGNGVKNCSEEPGLEDWTITIEGPDDFNSSTTTNEQGYYIFSDLAVGSYVLCEVQQDGWEQTHPLENNGCHLIEIENDNVAGVDFGNKQVVSPQITILAYKIVCASEEDLPNWGAGQNNAPSMIDENTANEFLASHPDCHLEADWDFQWGFQDQSCLEGVDKLIGDHLGLADGTESSCPLNCGSNTNSGFAYNNWKSFDSPTGQETPAMAVIDDFEEASGIWVRENLKEGYLPFSSPPQDILEDDLSAEMYCHDDISGYDNYDLISSSELGETYYCLAFNTSLPEPVCSISGVKFYDQNENGLKESSEEGLEDWTIQLKQSTACLEGDEWADEVVEYNKGRKDDFSEIDPDRADPANALGPAQDDDTLNFVSLGFNGSLILKFDNLIINGPGNDIEVVETTYTSPVCQDYSEKVRVYASQTGQDGSWSDLGIGCLDSQFDLGELSWAQYVKLVDETNPDDFGGLVDGYDVDGVKALHCSKWEIVNTQITDQTGHYCFSSVEPGSYRVAEALKEGWANSTPLGQEITISQGEQIIVDFGNYQTEEPEAYCGDGSLDPSEECDDGNTADGDGCSAVCQIEEEEPEQGIEAGDIIINEIMQNPAAVADSFGEWFELYNTTDRDLDLNGCLIRDSGTDSHLIATSSLVISSGHYAVLARNGDFLQNGGMTPDYVYDNFILGNEDDEIILECGNIEIDRVEYDNGLSFPDPSGASMILDQPSLDNNLGSNWCVSDSVFGDGDLGTPGTQNDSCQMGGLLTGCKYNDADNNGQIDQTEEKLGGWAIILEKQNGQDWQEIATTTTQIAGENQGCYLFDDLEAGDYRVSESLEGQTNWFQTYPTSTPYWELSLAESQSISDIDFANYYLSCTDNDSDGYAVEGGQCGLIDCHDDNPDINPGLTEICSNGIDDNCDEAIDCDDNSCFDDSVCLEEEPGPGPAAPRPVIGGGGAGPARLNIFNEKNEEVQIDKAILTWFTNLPATSQVFYDTVSHLSLADSPNYGYASATSEDPNKITFHTVMLTGLTPCTTYYWRAISHTSLKAFGEELVFTTQCPPEEIIEEEVIEEEIVGEAPIKEEVSQLEEIEEEDFLVTEAEAEEIVIVTEEKPEAEQPKEEKPKEEEKEVEEEPAEGLLAAMGNIFYLENFCWFFFLLVLALVILYLLSLAKKEKREEKIGEKKRYWLSPLLITILIILYSYLCCSLSWLLLLVIAVSVAFFLLFRKRRKREEEI